MTRGAAFVLAVGATCAALAYGGIWMYGDGFIFNRFTGTVIYVDLPEEEDTLDARATAFGAASEKPVERRTPAVGERAPAQAAAAEPKRTSRTSWSWPSSRVSSRSTVTAVPKRLPRPFTMPIATGVSPGRFDR